MHTQNILLSVFVVLFLIFILWLLSRKTSCQIDSFEVTPVDSSFTGLAPPSFLNPITNFGLGKSFDLTQIDNLMTIGADINNGNVRIASNSVFSYIPQVTQVQFPDFPVAFSTQEYNNNFDITTAYELPSNLDVSFIYNNNMSATIDGIVLSVDNNVWSNALNVMSSPSTGPPTTLTIGSVELNKTYPLSCINNYFFVDLLNVFMPQGLSVDFTLPLTPLVAGNTIGLELYTKSKYLSRMPFILNSTKSFTDCTTNTCPSGSNCWKDLPGWEPGIATLGFCLDDKNFFDTTIGSVTTNNFYYFILVGSTNTVLPYLNFSDGPYCVNDADCGDGNYCTNFDATCHTLPNNTTLNDFRNLNPFALPYWTESTSVWDQSFPKESCELNIQCPFFSSSSSSPNPCCNSSNYSLFDYTSKNQVYGLNGGYSYKDIKTNVQIESNDFFPTMEGGTSFLQQNLKNIKVNLNPEWGSWVCTGCDIGFGDSSNNSPLDPSAQPSPLNYTFRNIGSIMSDYINFLFAAPTSSNPLNRPGVQPPFQMTGISNTYSSLNELYQINVMSNNSAFIPLPNMVISGDGIAPGTTIGEADLDLQLDGSYIILMTSSINMVGLASTFNITFTTPNTSLEIDIWMLSLGKPYWQQALQLWDLAQVVDNLCPSEVNSAVNEITFVKKLIQDNSIDSSGEQLLRSYQCKIVAPNTCFPMSSITNEVYVPNESDTFPRLCLLNQPNVQNNDVLLQTFETPVVPFCPQPLVSGMNTIWSSNNDWANPGEYNCSPGLERGPSLAQALLNLQTFIIQMNAIAAFITQAILDLVNVNTIYQTGLNFYNGYGMWGWGDINDENNMIAYIPIVLNDLQNAENLLYQQGGSDSTLNGITESLTTAMATGIATINFFKANLTATTLIDQCYNNGVNVCSTYGTLADAAGYASQQSFTSANLFITQTNLVNTLLTAYIASLSVEETKYTTMLSDWNANSMQMTPDSSPISPTATATPTSAGLLAVETAVGNAIG